MSTNGTISMKIYTEAPVGTLLKFKLESNVAGFAKEQDAYTTVSGGWATYIWDLSNGDAPIYNVITLMVGQCLWIVICYLEQILQSCLHKQTIQKQ